MPLTGNEAARAQTLLDFWFRGLASPEGERRREVWFTVDPAFDAALRARFLDDQRRAAAGDYDGWRAAPDTCLALILLLDQLPRNLYRGSPAAYACDAKARAMAHHALERGFDRPQSPVRRCFLYLPFEHSEDLADQAVSLALFEALAGDLDDPKSLAAARRHHEIIARFGRFPHRNKVLGRLSTTEEQAFLKEPNSSF
jgi:uncharacterized protein (DUF924 family)